MIERKLVCGIVDDEKHARDLLAHYISKNDRLELCFEYATVIELEQNIANHAIDVLFLDVEMPGKTGLKFLEDSEVDFKIVLTTAYKKYALDGFELNVTDYLLKPIFEDRFNQAIDKVYESISFKLKAQAFDNVESKNNEFLTVKYGRSELKIRISEIIYISAQDEYVRFHFEEKTSLVYIRMKEVHSLLLHQGFTRIHRSYIINQEYISEIKTNEIHLNNDVKLPIGRSYKKSVKLSSSH